MKLDNNYSQSKPTAHIVINRNQFKGMGDIGFERNKKGFIMHADDYDWGKYGKKFKFKELNQTYTENKLRKYCRSTSKYNIMSRKNMKDGRIEIQLRVQQ